MSEEKKATDWNAIDETIKRALKEGRSRLYEHEVYSILDALGLGTPSFFFLREPSELTDELLESLRGEFVVLKVVSPDITHKEASGGVVLARRKLREVQEAASGILRRFRTPGVENPGPKATGILVVEHVAYRERLGNEILIGFRHDSSFGPVVTLSKGGRNAEAFARSFGAVFAAPVPLDKKSARSMSCSFLESLCGRETEWKTEAIASALEKMSELSISYSPLSGSPHRCTITDFEINPFVFDEEGKFIALDGVSQVEVDSLPPPLKEADPDGLDVFFEPRGVAVVGVSARDSSKMANQIASLLQNYGRDDLYLVNRSGGSVNIERKTYKLYKTLTEIPSSIDLVVTVVPARSTPEVMKEAMAKSVKGMILIPGGFGEVEGGKLLEEKVGQLVSEGGMRAIGPNCLGVLYPPLDGQPGINTVFVPKERFQLIPKEKRNVVIITQSGAFGISELDKLRGAVYPLAMVSYGNQLDVDASDLLAYFGDEPRAEVIALYIEGFKPWGGRRFLDVLSRIRKPVVIYKAGRTRAGFRAAAFHTASIAGDYLTAKAAFQQAGAVVADSIAEHVDLVKAFALLLDRRVSGKRVAAVVNAGFEATYAADHLAGLELAQLDEQTTRDLSTILPGLVNVSPLLDITPMADDELYISCIKTLLSDPNVDCLVMSALPYAVKLKAGEKEMAESNNFAAKLTALLQETGKPIVASVNTGCRFSPFVGALEIGGIPTFSSARRAMRSLSAFVKWKLAHR